MGDERMMVEAEEEEEEEERAEQVAALDGDLDGDDDDNSPPSGWRRGALCGVEIPLVVEDGCGEEALGYVGGRRVVEAATEERMEGGDNTKLELRMDHNEQQFSSIPPLRSFPCSLPSNSVLVGLRMGKGAGGDSRRKRKFRGVKSCERFGSYFKWHEYALMDFAQVIRPDSREGMPEQLVPYTALPEGGTLLNPEPPDKTYKLQPNRRKQIYRSLAHHRVEGLSAQVIKFGDAVPNVTERVREAMKHIREQRPQDGDEAATADDEEDESRPKDGVVDVQGDGGAAPSSAQKSAVGKKGGPNAERRLESLNALISIFKEHPLRSRREIESRAPPNLHYLYIGTLPTVAYNYNNGPWRNSWIRYGYDPTKRPEARFFQMMDLRLKDSFLKDILERAARAGRDNVEIFGEFKLGTRLYLPLNCITLRNVQDFLLTAKIVQVPNQVGGWFDPVVLAMIRSMVVEYLSTLFTEEHGEEGKVCGKKAYTRDEFRIKALGGLTLTELEKLPPEIPAPDTDEEEGEGESDGTSDERPTGRRRNSTTSRSRSSRRGPQVAPETQARIVAAVSAEAGEGQSSVPVFL